MGTWGEKTFQNDSALDWAADLETGGIELVRETLARVADAHEEEYVDVDDGAGAIAAAEIVAAALDHERGRLTDDVRAWVERNRTAVNQEDVVLANHAVRRVLAPHSELRSLWGEGGTDNAWRAGVQALLLRLGGDATGALPRQPRTSPRPVGQREKQVILTFLQARGLVFTDAQIERIEQSTDLTEIRRWLARATEVSSVEELFED
jgi:hypothetical protein